MPIRITFDNGEVIEADIPLGDWNTAYQRALATSTMVEIQDPTGHITSINPNRVNLVEATEPPAQATAQGHQREAVA